MNLRRYITRYLFGNINLEDIDDKKLVENLYKSDLWGINGMNQFDNIKNKLDVIANGIKSINLDINIAGAFGLYESIGDYDKEELNNFIGVNEEDVEDNNEDDEENNNDLFE